MRMQEVPPLVSDVLQAEVTRLTWFNGPCAKVTAGAVAGSAPWISGSGLEAAWCPLIPALMPGRR